MVERRRVLRNAYAGCVRLRGLIMMRPRGNRMGSSCGAAAHGKLNGGDMDRQSMESALKFLEFLKIQPGLDNGDILSIVSNVENVVCRQSCFVDKGRGRYAAPERQDRLFLERLLSLCESEVFGAASDLVLELVKLNLRAKYEGKREGPYLRIRALRDKDGVRVAASFEPPAILRVQEIKAEDIGVMLCESADPAVILAALKSMPEQIFDRLGLGLERA